MVAGDTFLPEKHLRQTGFTDTACVRFTKSKERIQKFKETGDSRCIYQNKLKKASFHYDIVYVDFKDLPRRMVFDKILCDRAFNIAMMWWMRMWTCFNVLKIFDKYLCK